MANSFRQFIDGLVQKTGTAGAVAQAIGMSLSAFSRGVRNEGTLSVENCLRLAEWSGESPGRVLHLANKGDVAVLIERLYGAERTPVSGPERELSALWRELEPDAQSALFTLLRALVTAARAKLPNRKAAPPVGRAVIRA